MSYIEAIILGLVQGLGEFLPISSSGHLALLQNFFGIDAEQILFFSVMLHLGTLVSVFIVYWKDICELVVELFVTIRDVFTGRGLHLQEKPVRKLGVMIIVATIPTAVIGLCFNDLFESFYGSFIAIGIGFLFTGFIMFLAERIGKHSKEIGEMGYGTAVAVGVMQGIAICPGVSRSGSTLVGGLSTGLKREFAVRFAFLISIPSILGSVVLELPDAIEAGIDPAVIGPIFAGMVVAAISGYAAIKGMIKLVSNGKLSYFSYYVWALGAFTLIYGLFIG